MNNGKFLAPRRALKSTMSVAPSSQIVLAKGEMFVEEDSTAGVFRIKFGDGETQYASLPYALSGQADDIKFDAGASGLSSTTVEDAIIEIATTPTGGGLSFGTCASTADTAAKAITVSSDQNFELKAGATVVVKFTYTNTASSVTLNVNSTGAKSIYYNAAVYTGSDALVCGSANGVNVYTYDGTNWIWIAHSYDKDTTYETMTAAELTTGSSTVARTVRADYLKTGVDTLIDNKTWTGTMSDYEDITTKDPTVNYYIIPSTAAE